MLHGSETWPVRRKLRAEMRMVTHVCGMELSHKLAHVEEKG